MVLADTNSLCLIPFLVYRQVSHLLLHTISIILLYNLEYLPELPWWLAWWHVYICSVIFLYLFRDTPISIRSLRITFVYYKWLRPLLVKSKFSSTYTFLCNAVGLAVLILTDVYSFSISSTAIGDLWVVLFLPLLTNVWLHPRRLGWSFEVIGRSFNILNFLVTA